MKTLHNHTADVSYSNEEGKQKFQHQIQLVQGFLKYLAPRLTIGVLLFVLSVLTSQAQYQSVESQSRILLRQAMLDMDRLDYGSAISKLLEHRALNLDNANTFYLLGKCYLYAEGRIKSFEKAAFYLEQASQSINPDYEFWILSESSAPPEVHYHLGKAHEKLNNYQNAAEALANYLQFLAKDPQIAQRSKMFASIEKTAIEFQTAANFQKNNLDRSVDNLAQKE